MSICHRTAFTPRVYPLRSKEAGNVGLSFASTGVAPSKATVAIVVCENVVDGARAGSDHDQEATRG